MPPIKKRNFIVVLCDVNAENNFQEQAKNAVLDVCSEKYFSNLEDQVKVLLLNTEDTHHGFEHIYDYRHITEPFEKMVLCTPNIIYNNIQHDERTDKGNWLEGLQIAIQTMIREVKDRKDVLTKQIIFVSDLSKNLDHPNERLANDIIANLNRHKIFLYVVLPRVKISKPLNPLTDAWYLKHYITIEDLNNDNLGNINNIIDSSECGIACDPTIMTEVIKTFKVHKGLQPWYCPLSIGSVLEIPTASRRLIRPPNTTFKEVNLRKTPWKWVKSSDQNVQVAYDNVISGYKFHNKFIPLTDDVKKAFKQPFPKCFKIFGVMDVKSLPQHNLCGETTYCVTGDQRNPRSVKVVNFLIDYLHKNGLCLRAGKVYAKNCNMRKMVLVPKPDFRPKCFFAAELPSADDVPVKYEERPIQDFTLNFNTDVKDSSYKYLDSIDLEQNGIPLTPLFTRNIYVTRLYSELLKKTSGLNLESNGSNLLNIEMAPEIDDLLLNICPQLGQN